WEALPPAMRGGHASTSAKLAPLVTAAVRPGDAVMVKASQGSRMGIVVRVLADLDMPAGDVPKAANGE
ncbi:MAG: UDP-N-acetylmuramoylalanyl-D-glutamyl-2, 6-diaminopimelate--D-alanyl-D-alanine ligase, partial [Rhodospirillaceae bacterium]